MINIINFYSPRNEHGYMSNFSLHPIVLDMIRYQTTEHYFQSKKFEGTPWEEKVRDTVGCSAVAILGRRHDLPLREDWESVKDQVMRKAVMAKFTQHQDIREQLLATGDSQLVEHTERDSYWGDAGDGSGKNMLGKILMEVRSTWVRTTLRNEGRTDNV